MSNINAYPKNVGLIMDGNGRWAVNNGLSRKDGHTEGIKNMLRTAICAFSLGVKNFVCYSLSIENLKREKTEVDHILDLISAYFDKFINLCKKYEISAKYVGNLELLPSDVLSLMHKTEEVLSVYKTKGRTIYVAVAYGSRDEIVSAVNKAIKEGQPVTKQSFLDSLYLPVELDLIVRTGGERRLSNFFLYQSCYAELFFSDKYFPDFTNDDLLEAFEWYANCSRRYGLIK